MPLVEIATPALKQDECTRTEVEGIAQPLLTKALSSAPGCKVNFLARMLTKNGIDVQSSVSYAFVMEWEEEKNFHEFIASPVFAAFGAQIGHLATRYSQPQLYQTDLSPVAAIKSSLTEVFRVKTGTGGRDVNAVKASWKEFDTAMKGDLPGVNTLSGTSLNLEQELFVGIIGWPSFDVREQVLRKAAVQKARSKLEASEGMDSFTLSLISE